MNLIVLETMAKKTQLQVKVSVMDSSNSDRMITEACDYHLICDKVRMGIVAYKRYCYADFGCNAHFVAKGLQNIETRTFMEVFESNWSQVVEESCLWTC